MYTTSVAPSVPVIVAGRACVSRFSGATAMADPGPTLMGVNVAPRDATRVAESRWTLLRKSHWSDQEHKALSTNSVWPCRREGG
ncbi:MAG: hypothetical protein EWM73_03719 [Nitrospira sp.]|nr:MAG: hypothetical protein EWM73_03719 [Nitrospira sp.]